MIEVREFFNPTVTPAQFSQLVAEAGAAEIDAMRGSVAERLNALAATGKLDPSAFYRPIVRQKLSALMGEQAAARLLESVKAQAESAASPPPAWSAPSPARSPLPAAAPLEGKKQGFRA